MKKLVFALMTFLMVNTITGCSKSPDFSALKTNPLPILMLLLITVLSIKGPISSTKNINNNYTEEVEGVITGTNSYAGYNHKTKKLDYSIYPSYSYIYKGEQYDATSTIAVRNWNVSKGQSITVLVALEQPQYSFIKELVEGGNRGFKIMLALLIFVANHLM